MYKMWCSNEICTLRRRRRLPGRCGRRGVQGAGVRGAEARGHAVPGPAGRPLGAAVKALLAGGLLREASGGPCRSDPEQHHTQSTLAHAHSTRRPVPSPLWAQGNKTCSILQYIPPPSTKKIIRLTAAALRVRLLLRALAGGCQNGCLPELSTCRNDLVFFWKP